MIQGGAVTTVEECFRQAGAVHKAEGENFLSTVKEQLEHVYTSLDAVAREEGDAESDVTTAECLTAVSLQEALCRERTQC